VQGQANKRVPEDGHIHKWTKIWLVGSPRIKKKEKKRKKKKKKMKKQNDRQK